MCSHVYLLGQYKADVCKSFQLSYLRRSQAGQWVNLTGFEELEGKRNLLETFVKMSASKGESEGE